MGRAAAQFRGERLFFGMHSYGARVYMPGKIPSLALPIIALFEMTPRNIRRKSRRWNYCSVFAHRVAFAGDDVVNRLGGL